LAITACTSRRSFCRQPDENHAAFLNRFLLEKSGRMYGMGFTLDEAGDVYLVGKVPLASVSADEIDRLLGLRPHLLR